MTGPPAPLRRSVVRALAVTALTVAALGVGPAVGSAFAAAQFSVNDPGSQFEGNTITFQITCTDTGGPPDDCDGASVDFATSNDTATAGADYDEVATTTVGFMGVGSEFINVTTIDDNVNENDETFFGDLTNDQPCCANSDIVDNRGTGIILDEEFQQQPSGNADLAVGKAESADPARVGDDLVYTIAVHNFGPSTASNVTMFDTLPGNVQFISAFPTFPGQGFCSFNGVSTVTCSIGTIVAGSTHFFDVRVRPTAAGTLQNTASASSSSNFDPFGGNNSATTLTATFVEGTTPPAPLPSPGVGSIASPARAEDLLVVRRVVCGAGRLYEPRAGLHGGRPRAGLCLRPGRRSRVLPLQAGAAHDPGRRGGGAWLPGRVHFAPQDPSGSAKRPPRQGQGQGDGHERRRQPDRPPAQPPRHRLI